MAGEQNSDERQTTNPALVRSVVEQRGGFPAHKAQTEGEGDHGLIVLGEYGGDKDVTEITWDEFEEEFEEKDLKFVYPTGSDVDEVGTLRKNEESSETGEANERQDNPEIVDKGGRYDDRYQEARETANPDDHRDEPPHDS